jgi:hypothetical protein
MVLILHLPSSYQIQEFAIFLFSDFTNVSLNKNYVGFELIVNIMSIKS